MITCVSISVVTCILCLGNHSSVIFNGVSNLQGHCSLQTNLIEQTRARLAYNRAALHGSALSNK